MSPEAQRIAIAEACGWREVNHPTTEFEVAQGFHPTRPQGRQRLPDYLTDLNAMHEAEKVLTESQSAEYQRHLEGSRRFIGAAEFFTYHATAAQRAEAFLRAIGKWEEA